MTSHPFFPKISLARICACLLCPWTLTQAQPVQVILKSGTRQHADLVEIRSDTVILQGHIRGELTQVRLPLSAFAEIRNRENDSLLYPLSPPDTISRTQEQEPHPWMGHYLFLPPVSTSLDSATLKALHFLWVNAFTQATRIPTWIPESAELRECADMVCLEKAARQAGVPAIIASRWEQSSDTLSLTIQLHQFKPNPRSDSRRIRAVRRSWIAWLAEGEPIQTLGGILSVPVRGATTPYYAKLIVETEPEGAYIAVGDGSPQCKSPCPLSIPLQDSARIPITASWKVEDNMWAARTRVWIAPGDSQHVFLKLRPTHPTVRVSSNPSQALIFKPDTPADRPLGKTPITLYSFEPGGLRWRISALGYRDTIVQLTPDPLGPQSWHIELQPEHDPVQLDLQRRLFREMKRREIGKTLTLSAIGPLGVGATFLWLADRDYARAQDIKHTLSLPAIQGENYQKLRRENQLAVEHGNTKVRIGLALLITGAIQLCAGSVLWF